MKTSTNKIELKELNACKEGYDTFIEAHGDKEAKLSECLDSNGWDDVWWLISSSYSQFSRGQRNDLRIFGCSAALINIEKIKPYCSDDEYKLITDYLNNPTESAAWSAAWSAERSAAESAAWSAAWSAAESAARSAWSAESAARSAWSAAESAARAAERSAWSARSAAESAAWSAAWSAAESAARSAWSAESAESAESAAMKEYTKELKQLFLKWENEHDKQNQ